LKRAKKVDESFYVDQAAQDFTLAINVFLFLFTDDVGFVADFDWKRKEEKI
jgi:hypothetical protein